MRPNIGSAALHDYVRPRYADTPDIAGCGLVIDHLMTHAARRHAARIKAELNAALSNAETSPGSIARTEPESVTFRSDKGLVLDDAVFTARIKTDRHFDVSAYYCTTNDPGVIARLRSLAGVTEVTD